MTETLTGERGLYGELDGFIPPNDLVSEADFAIGCVLAGPIWIEHSGLVLLAVDCLVPIA